MKNAKQYLFAFALTLGLGSAYAQTYTLSYTGNIQTINLTQVGTYEIECWGADGGGIVVMNGAGGGKGGYAKGILNVIFPNTQIHVFVGGKGNPGNGTSSAAGSGGWNGGGGGSAVGRSGGGGGGATDVRVNGTQDIDRVIVAGGGGGAAYYAVAPFLANGGNGGGIAGQNGDMVTSGGVLTYGGGGAGANGSTPGSAAVATANGTASGGGGGGSSAGTSIGQPGTGGGPGGAAGPSASGSTGSAGGGGGGYAGGAGGVQTSNAGVAGGGGSSYLGGVTNGITAEYLQPGYVFCPDQSGNGYVIIRYKCDVDVTASKNPICIGESVLLSSNAGSNIQWSHGPITPSVTVAPSTTTTYTLIGVSSTTTGCTGTVEITVEVNPLPPVSAAAFPSVVCQGNSGTITATGAQTYSWSPNGAFGNIVVESPPATTIYTVHGVSAHGCENTATVAMNINTNQLVTSPDTAVCVGSPAHLRADGAVSYYWTMGAPYQNVTVYPTTSTLYSVSALDNHNCPLGGSVTVIVNPLPAVNVSSSHSVICRNETLQLTASGAISYKWSDGSSGNSINPSTEIDIPLDYYVTGTNNNGCSSTASITVIVSACVSLDEEQAAAFKLMPNPANAEVTIESPGEATWKISDLAGRMVLEGELHEGTQTLNVSTLSSGVYLVQLQTGASLKTVRLIKN